MTEKWKTGSIHFDNLYTTSSWEYKIPYFGSMVQRGLIEREEKAIAFAGTMEGKTILDLGCGVGRFALRAASLGAIVYGYDFSRTAIQTAREKAEAMGLQDQCHFIEADLLSVDFPAADIWYDLGCLQYLPDVEPILQKLKNHKRFFSQLPRRGHWLNWVKFFYRNLLKGNPYRSYSENEIRKTFAICGEVNIEAAGVALNVTSRN